MANIALITNNVLSDSGTAITSLVSGSGTTNYLPKFTGSTALGNSIIYDNGTAIGIGTTSPLVALDVRGTAIIVNPGGSNYNENLRLPEATDGYAALTLGGSIAASGTSAAQWTLVKFPTSNNFSIRNNSSDYVTVFPSGNFAIGNSTDAGYKLDVVGNTVRIAYSAYAGIEYHNTTGTWEGYIGTENGSGNLRYNSRQGAHTWYYNSTATMTLTSGGNLGIGTTSPAYKLQVSGDIGFTAGANRYIRMASPASSGSANHIVIQAAAANTSGTGGNIYLYEGGGAGGPGPGSIYIGANNGWTTAYVTGRLTVTNSGPNTDTAFQVNAGGQNGLSIYWDNVTPYMGYGLVSGRQSRFYNSSSYSFDNNIIIGSNTNAGFKLDVNGTAIVRGQITYTEAYTGATTSRIGLFLNDGNLSYSNSENWVLWGTNAGANSAGIKAVWLGNNGYEMGLTFHTATGGNGAYSWPGGSEVMRLLNNKNVLIGASGGSGDSGFKLHVVNNGYYTAANGSLNAGNSLYVVNSGNVGIGTSSPAAKLQVTGSITAATALAQGVYFNNTLVAAANNDVLVGLDINNTFTNGAYTGLTNLSLRVNGYTRLIGSDSTGGRMIDVKNSSNSDCFYVRGYGDAYIWQTLYLGTLNGSSYISSGSLSMYSGLGTGGAFVRFIHNNGNNALRVLSNSNIELNPAAGNVLIGTTTDAGYKLQVNGTSSFGDNIYLTGASNRYISSDSSSKSIVIAGGTSALTGAYFHLTGNTYSAGSPGAGSAEFVIRTNSDSKFAMFGYNGSSWSRYMTLFGPTGNLNIGYGTSDTGYKLRIQGDTYNDGEIISIGNITTNASAYVNANQSGYNLTVYPDYTSGPNNLYSGGQVKANIYTSSVNASTQINPSSNATLMNWYPSTSQAVFIDYVIWIDGPNAWRSGTFMVVNDASGNVQTTDISTPDLNASTAGVILQAANYGGTMGFVASNTTGDVVYMNIITRYIPTMF